MTIARYIYSPVITRVYEREVITSTRKAPDGTVTPTTEREGWYISVQASNEMSFFVGADRPDCQPGDRARIILEVLTPEPKV